MTNLTSSKTLPVTVTISPHAKKRLVRLFVDDPHKRWKYRSKFSVVFGALNTKHDADYHYRLPFEPGQAYRVIQTFGGRVSHQGESEYAVDFAMPEGSGVCAARPGRVVATQSSSNTGGPRKKFRDEGNFIYIRHADRTLGVYVHLEKDGVLVDAGDYVRRGQLIGLSGNTGWSSRPHLHFGVYKLIGGGMGESFPFLFESKRGLVKGPLLGRAYSVKQ
ncbi:MAG: M23 family metallopeptidase [Planctomycetes bacterium]|nr:M23 family metallopeptidase [Planctomycetota bacterium]